MNTIDETLTNNTLTDNTLTAGTLDNHKSRSYISLQWKLTFLLTLLMLTACILMYFFISRSAVSGMDGLQDYMIQLDPQDGENPITLNVNPLAMFPQLEEEVQNTKNQFMLQSILATGIIILLSSLCTYFITRKTLGPLQKLNQEVRHIQVQNLSTQLAVPASKDDIAQLTSSFNEMLTRLDNAFKAQKQFSASAAHELRTPLAVLQTNLEVFQKKTDPDSSEYKQLFSMIQAQTARLSHLVETLLDMTNLKSIPRSDQVILDELIEEVFCDLDPVAERAGITLVQENKSKETASPSTVTGSYVLLYRAVYNLVENAIKYNRAGGMVTVTLKHGDPQSSDSQSSQITVLVKDTGIGISSENQEKIFAPFFRIDKSRSRAMGGAGLGLALVDSIAREHGGTVKVVESSEKGSTIGLTLPVGQ